MWYFLKHMALAGKRVAIDLGSETTRFYVPRRGLVLVEPSVIARDENTDEVVALGTQAVEMAGRSPDTITVVYPLQAGVIADYGATRTMLRSYLQETVGRLQLKRPEAMITVSDTATSTEKRALVDAGKEAGLQNVHLIRSAVAAALGAGLPITEARGNVIVDIGAGTTEIGIFSLGGIVAQHAMRTGGQTIDEAVLRFLRREHGLVAGAAEIRRIKHDFIDLRLVENREFTVHGRSTIQGGPKTVAVKLHHIQPHLETALERTVIAIRRVLDRTPPDLIGDIIKHGLVLSGGGAQLAGLPEYLSKHLRVAVVLAQDPELCAIKGAHMALTHLDDYKRSLVA